MKVERKKLLLDLLDQALGKKKAHVDSTKAAARNYAEQAVESYSINALRPNADAAVDFAKQLLLDVEALHMEITAASDAAPDRVLVPCHVVIRYNQPAVRDIEIYFVSTNLKLAGIQLVTPKSPLGQAITGKKVGDKVSFNSGGVKSSGEILKIE